MGEDAREVGAERLEDDSDKSAAQLRAEIEEHRADLGDTVEALAAKTDVKTRTREKSEDLKRRAVAKKDELVTKVKQSSPGGGERQGDVIVAGDGTTSTTQNRGGAGATVEQLKAKAQENPVPTAALAAFIGGVAFGRLTSRRG